MTFDYYIGFELEEFLGEDFTETDIEILEPEYTISKQYVSLLEVLLFPHLNKKVRDKKGVEQVFLSGFMLLEEIVRCLREDEKAATALRIRSDVKLLSIETDLHFTQRTYVKLLKKIAKLRLPYNPYISFSQISKAEKQTGQIIISLRDVGVLKVIADIIA